MQDGPTIAGAASLLGDPGRANMIVALMDGRALTASELTEAAGLAPSTASGHLAKLQAGGLVGVEKQGRHRYYRLAGPEVAAAVEALMGLSTQAQVHRIRTGPRDLALREARVCYDHLAGEHAVSLATGMVAAGWITAAPEADLTPNGRAHLEDIGVDVAALVQGRRPVCRFCLDWSERRSHLAGALGAALLALMLERGWLRRGPGRVARFSPGGLNALTGTLPLHRN